MAQDLQARRQKDLQAILKALFESTDYEAQPSAIIDLDCRDPSFALEIYQFVTTQTSRGSVLDKFPLEVIAVVKDKTQAGPIKSFLSDIPYQIILTQQLDKQLMALLLYTTPINDENSLKQLLTTAKQFEKQNDLLILQSYDNETLLAHNQLFETATCGWFPKLDHCYGYPRNQSPTQISLMHFQYHDFYLRHPVLDDLPSLVELEHEVWPEPIAMSEQILQERIANHPENHFAIEGSEGIYAVIYSQLIKSAEDLFKKHGDTVQELYDKSGAIAQLLALNVTPERWQLGLGGILIEFMLLWRTLQPNIKQVVGVTRWSRFADYLNITPEDYLTKKTADGESVDPVTRMHQNHGAVLKCLVPNYRPMDTVNQGLGVLVEYDLAKRVNRFTETMDKTISRPQQRITKDRIRHIIDSTIQSTINSEYRDKYTQTSPLMDLGLESLDLMSIRQRLSKEFAKELPPTFFFQYTTGQAIIDYFIETEIYTYKDWLYDVEWSELPIPLMRTTTAKSQGVWLVFKDDYGVSDELMLKLKAYNYQYIPVLMGVKKDITDQGEMVIRNDVPADFESLLSHPRCASGIRGVIYAWGLFEDVPSEPTLEEFALLHRQSCMGLLNLIKSIKNLNMTKVPNIYVTSWSLQEEGDTMSLAQWPLSGLSKAIVIEHPEFHLRIISFDKTEDIKRTVDNCFTELFAQDEESQIIWRHGKRLSPRLIRRVFPDNEPCQFATFACYLIIGGFGLALKIAEWYVEHGAKNLAIISPHKLPVEAEPILQNLVNQNINIKVYDDINIGNVVKPH